MGNSLATLKEVSNQLCEFESKDSSEEEIKKYFSELNLDTKDYFVSKNPYKIKLLIPPDMYGNNTEVVGIHPFDTEKGEILKKTNKKNKTLYHFMDVGGYSSVPDDSQAIKIYNIEYEVLKDLFAGNKMYEDLLKRYNKVNGNPEYDEGIDVVVLKIVDTTLYVINSVMPTVFNNAYLDNDKKTIYLFKNKDQDNDKKFKISKRTNESNLFPVKIDKTVLYSNIYPGKFGNNNININNINEINGEGQKFIKNIIQKLK